MDVPQWGLGFGWLNLGDIAMRTMSDRLMRAISEAKGEGDEDKEKDEEGREEEDAEASEEDAKAAEEDAEAAEEDAEEGEGEDSSFEDEDPEGEEEFNFDENPEDDDLDVEGGIDDELALEDDSDIGGDGFPDDEVTPEDLLGDEPPNHEPEVGVGDDLNKVSSFDEFVTNQLLDFPVEDVSFSREEGAVYVDAKFGENAISFALYKGEEGQPLLAILKDGEVYRTELPPEAMSGDGEVRDQFMPVDWVRDILAKFVDVAPEFECYRFSHGSVVAISKKVRPLREALVMKKARNSGAKNGKSVKTGKPGAPPKTLAKRKVNKGGATVPSRKPVLMNAAKKAGK